MKKSEGKITSKIIPIRKKEFRKRILTPKARIGQPVRRERRVTIASFAIPALILWLLIERTISQFQSYTSEIAFLRVAAKCPGLPYGSNSGGPDYINIAIDLALAIVAGAFVALTIRDWRKRKKTGSSENPSGA